MSTARAPRNRRSLAFARAAFEGAFGSRPEWSCRAPGRVNLIGGHVDYNQGLVLPAAVDIHIELLFRPRPNRRVRIRSIDFEETAEFDIAGLEPGAVTGWAAYPAGVAWAMERAGLELRGLDATLAGDVPIAAGLSSSAALEVAFGAAFRGASDLRLSDLEMARICQTAENEFVGVRCGIMDQVASACARADHAILLDCRDLSVRQVPIPPTVRIVVLDTGIERELRASEFNARREQCEEAVRLLAQINDDITSLRDVAPEDLPRLLRHLPAPLDRRVRHVVGEIERVRLAAAALEQEEMERFAELMYASHRSSRDDYETSSDELDALVELARSAPGCLGARLSGAGFGGCTVNLVAAALTQEFVSRVSSGYERLFGRPPEAFATGAAAGARVERLA